MQKLQKPKHDYKLVTLRPRYRQLEIPIDWKIVELSDLCILVNGMAFKPEDWKTQGLPIIRIQNLNNEKANFNYYDEPVEEKYYVDNGDILFGWSGNLGTSFGAHLWKNGKAILNQHIFKVIPNDSVSPDFLFYMLNRLVKEIELETHGSIGLVHVKKGYLESRLIPLPTIKEQQKVASILLNVDSLIIQTQKEIEQTQRLKKGLMQKLLTRGIGHTKFKEHFFTKNGIIYLGTIPYDWDIKTIKQLENENQIIGFQDGNHGELHPKGDDFTDEGKPFITASQIDGDGNINLDQCKKLPESFWKKLRIGFSQANDVLFTHNATVGRVSVLPNNFPDCIVGTSVTYYRLNDKKIDRFYFSYVLQSNFIKKQYGTRWIRAHDNNLVFLNKLN